MSIVKKNFDEFESADLASIVKLLEVVYFLVEREPDIQAALVNMVDCTWIVLKLD